MIKTSISRKVVYSHITPARPRPVHPQASIQNDDNDDNAAALKTTTTRRPSIRPLAPPAISFSFHKKARSKQSKHPKNNRLKHPQRAHGLFSLVTPVHVCVSCRQWVLCIGLRVR